MNKTTSTRELELIGVSRRSFERATAAARARAAQMVTDLQHQSPGLAGAVSATMGEVTRVVLSSQDGVPSFRVHLRVVIRRMDSERSQEQRATLAKWLTRLSA